MRQRKHKQLSHTPSTVRSDFRSGWLTHGWLPGLTLVLMVAIVYLPALWAGAIMDDDIYLNKSSLIRSVEGLRRAWCDIRSAPQYYPFLQTTLGIQYQLWGDNLLGYHLVNVVLHASVVLWAWRILLRLDVPGAWLAAAVFAVHPVCVETVAWITKLMNLESMLLALGSMWCYLRFEPPVAAERDKEPTTSRWPYYILSLTLFLLALLSKTVVASLPAVLLVVYWWKRGKIVWHNVWPLAPFFFFAITLGLLTAYLERSQAGAVGDEWSFTLVERCLIAGRAVWFYASKLVWPYPLMFYYPRWTINTESWWQYVFSAGVLAVVATLWLLRKRIGRGPLAAVLIYLGVLFPALGFFNIYAFRYSFVADHYQYHAMLAIIALAGAATIQVAQSLTANRRTGIYVAAVGVLAVFGTLTYSQAMLYRDAQTLYRDTIIKNPRSWVAHSSFGMLLSRQGLDSEAILEFHKALELNPNDAKTHFELANVLMESSGDETSRPKQLQEALDHLHEALRLLPNDVDVLSRLVNVLTQKGQPEEAKKYFDRAALIDRAQALYGLGAALWKLGKLAEAEPYLEESVRLNPTIVEAHQALGVVLALQNKLEPAAEQFRQSVSLRPDYFQAWNNLAATLINMRKPDEALPCIQRALQLRPNDPDANKNLKEVLRMQARRLEGRQGGIGQRELMMP